MDHCWILIGMMGAGKSSIGRALAELSGREFVDTDLILQQRLGRPISQIFQIYGEQAFRDHESSVIRNLQPSLSILSTGGGIVLRDENWCEFRRLGTTIFLDASVETLIARLAVSKKKRPLLQTEDWEDRVAELLEARRELYERADLRVLVDGVNLTGGAEQVYETIRQYESDADRTPDR